MTDVAVRPTTELSPQQRWPGVPADVADNRAAILKLEAALFAGAGGETVTEFESFMTHRHADGVYAREFRLPKGMVVIGKIHKHAHLNVISKGHVLVVTPTEKEELKAPLTFISKPGTKRAVVALEDTIWTTFHGNPTRTEDLAVIEDYVIAPTFEHFDALLENKQEHLLEKK